MSDKATETKETKETPSFDEAAGQNAGILAPDVLDIIGEYADDDNSEPVGEVDKETRQAADSLDEDGEEDVFEQAAEVAGEDAESEETEEAGEDDEGPEEDEDGNFVLTKEAYERFMAERNELAKLKLNDPNFGQAEGEEAPAETPAPEPARPVLFDANALKPPEITDEEFEDIASDPKKFADYIHKAQTKAIEHVMEALPGLVLPTVVAQTYQSNLVFRFMRENPGLAPYRDAIVLSMMEAYGEKPDASEDEILEAVRSRVAHGAKTKAAIRNSQRVDRRSKKRGRFAPGGTNARGGRSVPHSNEDMDPTDEAFKMLMN